jgi:hypothetical protein
MGFSISVGETVGSSHFTGADIGKPQTLIAKPIRGFFPSRVSFTA